MSIQPEQQRIAAILGSQAFVKVAAEHDALFVSDAPRRMTGASLSALGSQLAQAGFVSWENERGLLLIDWDDAHWRQWAEGYQAASLPGFPAAEEHFPIYALARLLAAHPYPLAAQPRAPIRLLLKNLRRTDALARAAFALHERCAQWLREGEPLPSAAAGLLSCWLRTAAKEVRS